MLEHLPESKTLWVFKGFCNLDLFLWFTQGTSVVGEDRQFGFGDGGDRDFLGIEDLLRVRGAGGWLRLVGGSTILGIMSHLSAFKALALPHTFCTFLWGKFL